MKTLDKRNIFVEKGENGEIDLTYDPNVSYDYKNVENEIFVNIATGDRIPYGDLIVKVNDKMTDIYLYPLSHATSSKAIKDYKIDRWVSIKDPRAKEHNEDEIYKILDDLVDMTGDLLNVVKLMSSTHPKLNDAINRFEYKYTNCANKLKNKNKRETNNLNDNNKTANIFNRNGIEVVK